MGQLTCSSQADCLGFLLDYKPSLLKVCMHACRPIYGPHLRFSASSALNSHTEARVSWLQCEAFSVGHNCVLRLSISWLPSTYPKSGMQFEARFARNDCAACPMRNRCTRSKVEPRIITLQAREDFDALQSARRNQATEEFRKSYAARAGIEGTHAQAIRRCGLRRCRYIGLAKIRLQHVITAVTVNLVRVAEWHNDTLSANTRISQFAALQMVA